MTIESLSGTTFDARPPRARRGQPTGRTYREPAREIPVYAETDVLVVGGGPAGCAAAAAAARLGAHVTLVERYGHLGGLATGGLVIWIDRMTDWEGRQVITGFASDLLDRLPKDAFIGPDREQWGSRDAAVAAYWAERSSAFKGVVTWSPTVDPEWLKLASLQAVIDAGVTLMLHTWGAAPIVEDHRLAGVVFESKEGRQAIRATVVVDTTGDGDLYALAGAPFESDVDEASIHHAMNVAWLWAGVDMERWLAFKTQEPQAVAVFMDRAREALGFAEKPHVAWRSDVALFMGPRLSGYSPLVIEDLTAVEIESRRRMVEHLEFFRRHAPGFEHAWIMLTAPQMGARHSRRLAGVAKVVQGEWKQAVVHPDEIGVSPGPSPQFANVSIPYGSLVPKDLDNLLTAGRHISCDPQSHTFLREIPQCWMTGQAAGVAAALAAGKGVTPRRVPVAEIQQELTRQGVFLQQRAPVEAR
ncbi:MAG: FAD-dependent oxidoreductase [Candidatus Rokubacteria bacterium]|nr:FAD-dependent oxidoreductase [Candidatus Rokubacteria bacterium]